MKFKKQSSQKISQRFRRVVSDLDDYIPLKRKSEVPRTIEVVYVYLLSRGNIVNVQDWHVAYKVMRKTTGLKKGRI